MENVYWMDRKASLKDLHKDVSNDILADGIFRFAKNLSMQFSEMSGKLMDEAEVATIVRFVSERLCVVNEIEAIEWNQTS